MTNVTLYLNNKQLVGFKLEGHADYAEKGYDIVCAAISVLATTAINSLESVGKVKPVQFIDEEKAFIHTMLPDNISPQQRHDCKIILSMLEQGLTDIAEQYPKYLKINRSTI
ncbi:MAG: ribosomal-processing cysteine protease Prp [Christensenellaceae bacterium]|nr:ribosomal-processing cysteine protease Prp [Christensenellaceae bacterium]